MTTTEEFAAERAQLGQRDRDELHEIASAMGVRGATRLRKADLIEAILDKATSGASVPEPTGDKPKKRATRKKTADTESAAPSAGDGAAGDTAPAASAEGAGGASAEAPPAAPAPAPARGERPKRTGDTAPVEGAAQAPASTTSGGETQRLSFSGDSATSGAASTATASTATGTGTEQGPSAAGGGSASAEGGPAATTTTATDRDLQGGGQSRGDDSRDGFAEGRSRRRRRRGRDRGFEPGAPSDGGGSGQQHQQSRERESRPFEPAGEPIEVQGLLEIRDEGYGFMRTGGFLAGRTDVYVSASQIRRFGMRKGDYLKGATRPAASNEKYPALLRLDEINGMSPEEARVRPRFEDLTPLFPDEKLRLEMPGEPNNLTGRIVDLVSPIGKGQRGLIVSPPKAGKTTIMKQIVHSIERNNPEVHLIVLLVDERPEEVTDMKRHVINGEVIASTFDRPAEEHTQVAELAIERAKRLVETGKDVVIILDGITRLARAYNLAAPASGRILSGGVDSGALYPPKKFFGAARNIEEGGSLTILATALIETGSRMDEVIFEEFKGTGNMELRLDRRLAERRIYPAIDVEASSTRHEELLFDRTQLQQVWKLRRVLNALEGGAGLELLMDKIRSTRSNDEFLAEIAKAPTAG
ncbi:MAG TPA: transcription termination factor Rho [Acidimicrobiia bacterium]|nr:transcription termination factor Rho [Acidimicrobiia bacterium]